MKNQLICTDGNILVKEFKDTESESGIVLGDGNSEAYSLYEVIDIAEETHIELSKLIGSKEKLEDYLLVYSGFARIPLTRDKFIVHVKDCLGLVKRDKYRELIND